MADNLIVKFKIPAKNNLKSTKGKNAFLIEGGGTKGIYAIGVIKYLFEPNPYIELSNVDIFGGTSVGSYIALALSLGYTHEDTIKLSQTIDLSAIVDNRCLFMLTIYRYLSSGYFYNDSGREQIIRQIISLKLDQIAQDLGEKVTIDDLTIGHLKKLINLFPSRYKHLVVNAVDINITKQVFFTTLNDESDGILLLDAVLASSALPIIFKPTIMYRHPNGRYSKSIEATQTDTQISHLYDGGLGCNNPLDFFLLHDEIYGNYNLWLLKFTAPSRYTKVDGTISLFKQLINFLFVGKDDIKVDLVHEDYHINIFNLHLNAGTLDIYTQEQIQKIVSETYLKCKNNQIHLEN